jgi:XTP/dITP diphosphohydrolase
VRIAEPITLASRNAGKLAELEALAAGAIRLRLAPAGLPEIPEDEETYLGNALAKARGVAAAVGGPTLADDSGLEVDALRGAPGVRSARFGGSERSDAERCGLLLEAIAAADRRSARFRCVLVVFDGREWCSTEGVLEGEITRAPRGSGGFGYDPIFAVPALGGRTLAEIEAEEKNRISHRAVAMQRLLVELGVR